MKTRVCPIYFVHDCIVNKCALIQLSVLLLECHLLLIKNITIKKLTITSHDLGETLQKLNDIVENIEFTMQKASEENLPFLVCIISENEKREIITKACRKLTHTGQYTHFSSNQPLHVKLSTTKTLVRRANFISSDQTSLNKEILYFTKMME